MMSSAGLRSTTTAPVNQQPLCIEFPGGGGGAGQQILTRLYEDLESNPSMREQRSSEVFWRPHQVPGDPSSRSPRGAPPADRGPPAPEDPMNRNNLGETLSREATSRRLLETNFDETPQHTRSASYSSLGLQDTNGRLPAGNLNSSFPSVDLPYISSSVTLPVSEGQPSFYQNVSGRIRQEQSGFDRILGPNVRQKEEARASFARQAELHKSPRTQELEEFAAKFEGYQKQRTRRLAAQPTPMLDQLARETNNQFWLANAEQLSVLETSLLRLVQRTDSTRARTMVSDGDTSSGRESVTTVISTSSSETVKWPLAGGEQERHSSSETLRWEEEEGMREAVRRVASTASNGSDSNFDSWDLRGQERPPPARRLLARSRSEAGASDGDNFNESHRKFSESFNESSFRASSSDFEEAGWRRNGVGSRPNSHGSAGQKETGPSGRMVVGGTTCLELQDGATRSHHQQIQYNQDCNFSQPTTQYAQPIQDCNGASHELAEKSTLPRRTTSNGHQRARKPKLPTPPSSPKVGFGSPDLAALAKSGRPYTPSPPPPPPQECDDLAILATNEPLPPPPLDTIPTQPQPGLPGQPGQPDPVVDLGGVHHASPHQGGHQGNQGGGGGGHQRGQLPSTTSAPTASTPTPVPRGKTPASTPKRESPATIAAKEAPGWQMFLGVKSSTVSFTSEEASKFRATRDSSRTRGRRDGSRSRNWEPDNNCETVGKKWENGSGRAEPGKVWEGKQRKPWETAAGREEEEEEEVAVANPEKRPKTRRQEYRQARQAVRQERKVSQEVEDDSGAGRPLRSPDEKQASLHLSRERSLKSISNWWRSSLEGGPIQPSSPTDCWTEPESTTSPRHNHSHSDSGISSMSGRSSCISPMSELSSSSGSSRTSLRSSSIVSASNILLEEEGEEEVEYKDLCKELLLFAPPDSRISGIIRSNLTQMLQVYFPEGSLQFEIRTASKENLDSEPSKRSRSTNFEESRRNLLKQACLRIDTQRKHQILLKESTKNNEEGGKEIVLEVGRLAQQTEIDKVRLFTEEVDKITSLVIGLSSRLAKASLVTNNQQDEKLQRVAVERMEKLGEQLEEARKLRQSIFRRGDAVFAILARYLDPRRVEQFGEFIKEKIRLIVETRQQSELVKGEEELIKCLKEYTANNVMII